MIDLKTLDLQQLNLVLHNMRIYGVSKDKQDKVINEINSRNDASNK
tara:strand:- start:1517 stop:1654 length:138 start_codon:yes stop_codon:yes gene_type:complete